MLTWILVLLAYTALDFVFARYTKAVSDGYPLRSAVWATHILLFSGYVTISYINDPMMLIPAGIGAFVGTWVAVKSHKEKV